MDLKQLRQQALLEDVKKRMASVMQGGEARQAKIFEEVKKSVGILRTVDNATAELYLKMAWNQLKSEPKLEFERRIYSMGKSQKEIIEKASYEK